MGSPDLGKPSTPRLLGAASPTPDAWLFGAKMLGGQSPEKHSPLGRRQLESPREGWAAAAKKPRASSGVGAGHAKMYDRPSSVCGGPMMKVLPPRPESRMLYDLHLRPGWRS